MALVPYGGKGMADTVDNNGVARDPWVPPKWLAVVAQDTRADDVVWYQLAPAVKLSVALAVGAAVMLAAARGHGGR